MSHAEASPSEPLVLEEKAEGALWLTLNRPKRRNPLSGAMITALAASLDQAYADDSVRVIVIAAAGPVFSAGHDLKEMSRSPEESKPDQVSRVRGILQACSSMMLGMVQSPKAIIACIEGTATAAGCQLVSACDLAIASEEARFATPGVNIGSFCTTPLVGIGRNMHRKHAMELALTGEMFSAADAVRMGLVNRAVPRDQVRPETGKLAESIASRSARGIAAGKAAFYHQIDLPIEQAFEFANQAMLEVMTSDDAEEGTRAFLEKRKPVWK
ncbi:MAG: enoyl-CoA hydratase [Xanthomonadales bacterium]|nr:enoyl-CoA hydratase [Xanthomonadales bacterium]